MEQPGRRTNARYACELKVEVHTGPTGGVRLGDALILDISVSGALLRFSGSLKAGASYRLRHEGPEGALDLPCRGARDAGRAAKDATARHYGLAFNLTGGQEKALRKLIDWVRRQPPAADDEGDFMRDYWSR